MLDWGYIKIKYSMLGKIIKIFREKRGIGVMELAKKLGINRISLFRIEKEERAPSEETALKAFRIFGLSEENIYQIFIFNELVRFNDLSRKAGDREVRRFLAQLNKNDENGKIIYDCFNQALKEKTNVSKEKK
ncbi:MAG: helix-turn-helix transcriptional regulator [Patescibacteria group bacterium]